jgi:hypothetical protein
VEQDDECVPGADAAEPCHGVDGLGEKADVLRGQPARIDVGDDLGGIERLGAEPVVTTSCQTLRTGGMRFQGALDPVEQLAGNKRLVRSLAIDALPPNSARVFRVPWCPLLPADVAESMP